MGRADHKSVYKSDFQKGGRYQLKQSDVLFFSTINYMFLIKTLDMYISEYIESVVGTLYS